MILVALNKYNANLAEIEFINIELDKVIVKYVDFTDSIETFETMHYNEFSNNYEFIGDIE